MNETKNILFASNLSKDMKTVFKHAATTALLQKVQIVVVHVMEENPRSKKRMKSAFGEQIYQDLKSEHREDARNILVGKNVDALRIRQAIAGFLSDSDQGQSDDSCDLISKILVTESPAIADEIASLAVEEDCGLIVMGYRQQGFVAKAMGDNVVRKLMRRSSVPVLLVPLDG